MEIYVLFVQGEEGPEMIHASTDIDKLKEYMEAELAEFREEMGEGELCVPEYVVEGNVLLALGNDYGNGDIRDIHYVEKADVI
jgi:hypothetical protein